MRGTRTGPAPAWDRMALARNRPAPARNRTGPGWRGPRTGPGWHGPGQCGHPGPGRSPGPGSTRVLTWQNTAVGLTALSQVVRKWIWSMTEMGTCAGLKQFKKFCQDDEQNFYTINTIYWYIRGYTFYI